MKAPLFLLRKKAPGIAKEKRAPLRKGLIAVGLVLFVGQAGFFSYLSYQNSRYYYDNKPGIVVLWDFQGPESDFYQEELHRSFRLSVDFLFFRYDEVALQVKENHYVDRSAWCLYVDRQWTDGILCGPSERLFSHYDYDDYDYYAAFSSADWFTSNGLAPKSPSNLYDLLKNYLNQNQTLLQSLAFENAKKGKSS